MWYGTDNGVLQFDGIKFKLFTTQDGLPDNEIFNFCEDPEGRIWFASFNGNLGYYKQGQLFNENNTPWLKIEDHLSYIYLIEMQIDSSLLFLYNDSRSILKIKGNSIRKIEFEYDKEILGGLKYVTTVQTGKYVGYTNKAKIFFKDNKIIHVDTTQNLKEMFYNSKIYSRNIDSLFYFQQGKKIFSRTIEKRFTHTFNYYVDPNNYLFEGTDRGLFIYLPNSKTSFRHLLSDCKVSSINNDLEGNYWVSTLNKGVYFFPKGFWEIQFIQYPMIGKINTLRIIEKKIYLFTEDDKIYQLNENNEPELYFDLYPFIRNSAKITRIQVANNQKNIVIGGNVTVSLSLKEPKPLLDKRMLTIPGYKKDLQWINDTLYWHNNINLVKAIQQNGELTLKTYSIPDSQRIFDLSTFGNQIWVSTLKNVYYLENEGLKNAQSLSNYSFRKFNCYQNKFIGITHDYKLVVATPHGSQTEFKIQVIAENCAWMEMNYIFGDNILLRSDKGYYILNIASDLAILNPSENVLLPVFPQEIVCDSPYVYFLSVENSITKIHYSTILAVPFPPKLIIKSFNANSKYYDFERKIFLKNEEATSIHIEFTGIGFNRKRISYQYQINGQEWIDIEESRISLINPSWGNYRINIRSKSDSSQYGDASSLEFFVSPPWYATWWFLLMSLVIVIGIVYYILKEIIHKNNLVKENNHQKEIKLLHSEFKSLNALMNPHFIFNSLNNIQYLINDDKKDLANQYLGVFSKLIRQNMENISKEMIGLDKELNLVKNYLELEKLRFGDKLNYEIKVDDEIDLNTVMAPPLLIQPLVENAIKHGILQGEHDHGNVHVEILEIDGDVLIKVTDNGKGLGNASVNDGLHQSMKNIRQRLQQLTLLHGRNFNLELQTLKNEQGDPVGTEARILITL